MNPHHPTPNGRLRARLSCAAALAGTLSGCSETGGNRSIQDVLAGLSVEAEHAGELVNTHGWGRVTLILLASLLAGWGVSRLLARIRAAGYDERRRLSAGALAVQALLVGWAASVVIREIARGLPTLALALVALVLGFGALVLASRLRGTFAALIMMARGRLHDGDTLRIGDISGVVTHVGLLRLELVEADGTRLYVSTHRLTTADLQVSSPRQSSSVSRRVARATAWTPSERETVRRLALLCPYRDITSDVEVSIDPADESALTVSLSAWSEPVAQLADDWLRDMLRAPAATQRGPSQ